MDEDDRERAVALRLFGDRRRWQSPACSSATGYVAGAALLVALRSLGAAIVAALVPTSAAGWSPASLYAGIVLVAPAVLRRDPEFGFLALIFLFAIVWATDIFAYFGGRLIGGPKLWRRISPKKTWSGAIGGAVGAVVAGAGVAVTAGLANSLACRLAGLATLGGLAGRRPVGIGGQAAVRCEGREPPHSRTRRLMDRLDGFLAAACVAAIIGVARGGLDAPARGLLVW